MNDYITNSPKSDTHNLASGRAEPPAGDVRSPTGGRSSLPCLNSNISIEMTINSTQIRKSSNALSWNVQSFSERFGLENLGFLTLTFKDHVICPREAQKRLNSLISNVIVPRYKDYIGVMERQKSGRIHYHFLINIGSDVRSGVDFNSFQNRDYKTAPNTLRSEWTFWRKTAPKYRFGRTEVMPIKSTSEAIGKYVGKYIGKHIESRLPEDKNARLVRYSRGARMATTRFMFLTDGSAEWRAKVAAFAEIVSMRTGKPPTFETLREELGSKWAHNNRDFISQLPVLSN